VLVSAEAWSGSPGRRLPEVDVDDAGALPSAETEHLGSEAAAAAEARQGTRRRPRQGGGREGAETKSACISWLPWALPSTRHVNGGNARELRDDYFTAPAVRPGRAALEHEEQDHQGTIAMIVPANVTLMFCTSVLASSFKRSARFARCCCRR